MPDNSITEKATDLLVKALQLSSNDRIELVRSVLKESELPDAQRKKVQELVRKACEARDKVAIALYDVELVDPRQLPLDFNSITPEDFA